MYQVLIITETSTWFSPVLNRREAIKYALKALLEKDVSFDDVVVTAVTMTGGNVGNGPTPL